MKRIILMFANARAAFIRYFNGRHRLLRIFCVQAAVSMTILGAVFLLNAVLPDGAVRGVLNYNVEFLGARDNEIGKIKFVDKIVDRFGTEVTDVTEIIMPVSNYSLDYYGGVMYLMSQDALVRSPLAGRVSKVMTLLDYRAVQITAGNIVVVVGTDFITVREGDKLSAGDIIGANSGQNPIFLAIYEDGKPIDAASIIKE